MTKSLPSLSIQTQHMEGKSVKAIVQRDYHLLVITESDSALSESSVGPAFQPGSLQELTFS